MGKSIKEQIIFQAQRDPFLTVEELGLAAQTTPRYVRTVLSEAGLSLNELRRQYARALERRLGEVRSKGQFEAQKELRIIKIKGKQEGHSLVDWGEDQDLFQISTALEINGIPSYIRLITREMLAIPASFSNLREFLPGFEKLRVGEQRIEIVPLQPELSSVLALPRGAQALKLSSVLHLPDQKVALEQNWLALSGLVLHWSPQAQEFKISLTG